MMTKQEYLHKIEMMLMDSDADFRNDILNDFNEHFEQGIAKGRTEDEIAESLGDVSELIQELKVEKRKKTEQKNIQRDEVTPDIKKVQILGLSAEVKVRPAVDNQIDYVLNDSSARVNVHNYIVEERVKGDELIIEVKPKERRLFFLDFVDLHLDVKLPNYLTHALIDSISGDIDIDDLAIENLEVRTKSGNVLVQRSQGNLTVKAISGDIDVKSADNGTVDLETTSGDIDLRAHHVKAIRAHAMSGDVEVEVETTEMAQLESLSGDLSIRGFVKNLSCDTKSGDVDAHCPGVEAAKLDSISGDVELIIPNCPGMKCSCKTISGDVDIDLNEAYDFHKSVVTFGDQSTIISLKSISGDITVGD